MGAAARLAELGLELPEVALPLAAYVPAVRSGSYVYTSGQLPFVAGTLPATGKVGQGDGLISPEDAAGYARLSALNALAAVAAVVAAEGGPQGADALDRIVADPHARALLATADGCRLVDEGPAGVPPRRP